MNLTTITRLALATLLFTAACSKKDASGSAGDHPAAKPDESAPPVAKVWKPLAKVGVQVEVPGDMETMEGNGDAPGYSLFNNSDCKLTLGVLPPAWPQTYDAAKAEIQKDPMKTFKAFTKDEKTADGYRVDYTAESSMEKGKAMYGFEIRRKIAGKDIVCYESVDSAAGRDCAAAICLAAKPL